MAEKLPKRKPNWTDTEQVVMLDLYAKYRDVLGSRETSVLSCHEKSKCWVQITQQLNQVNASMHRSVEEVKRKWHNLLGQGRRDFFDWKRARQDPNVPAVAMPIISRRALELHGGFKFGGLTDQEAAAPELEEFIYLEAEDRSADELLDSSGDASAFEVQEVKQEYPGPVARDDFCEDPGSLTSGLAMKAAPPPPPHPHPTVPSSSFQRQSSDHPPAQPAASPQIHAVPAVLAAAHPAVPSRPHISAVAPQLSYAPQIAGLQLSPLAMTSANQNLPSSAVSISPHLETLPLAGRVTNNSNPHPSEPTRKKFRGSSSEYGQTERVGAGPHAERGAGPHAEREAELRLDILQLEKDKLWLETEKLRLEIDILRKQKQQMNNF